MAERVRLNARWRLIFAGVAVASLVWMLVVRVLGPSDVWDQTQPKTVSYTTDIIIHHNWILPIERGELPATKPPLYNWLAVPAVSVFGFNSEFAHKLPSVLAIVACCVMLVVVGRRIVPDHAELGYIAAMMLPASYSMFKLGYLARPDMLLTMWILLGWIFAMRILLQQGDALRPASGFAMKLAFWLCVGLAGLTKGPAVAVLIVFAIVGGRIIGGKWRSVLGFGWLWGLPLSLAMVGAWLFAAYRINPEHVKTVLWGHEIYGRVMGSGPEGARGGPIEFITGFPNMAVYYMLRFGPWSLLAIGAVIALLRRPRGMDAARWRTIDGGAWLLGSAILAGITVVLFTLSAGKRADYVAVAFPPSCLLAAWAVVRLATRWPIIKPLTIALVAIALTLMTVVNQQQPAAPSRAFASDVAAFIDEAAEVMRDAPAPAVFWAASESHVQAFLGHSQVDGTRAVRTALRSGEAFYVVAGRRKREPVTFEAWFTQDAAASRSHVVTLVVESQPLPEQYNWPSQLMLYRVERPR